MRISQTGSGEWKQARLEVIDILCSKIHEEGMFDRVWASNDATGNYCDKTDDIKKEKAKN